MTESSLSQTVGVVSMMKNGMVSKPVRRCFASLGYKILTYRYDEPRLYSLIASSSSPTHWFFTGNGPDLVTNEDAPTIDERIYTIRDKMMFFVCYSHQLIAKAAGCVIWQMPNGHPVNSNVPLIRIKNDPIFNGILADAPFFAYYNQFICQDCVPVGWKLLAVRKHRSTPDCKAHVMLMKHGSNLYSCQVHPERRSPTYRMIANWLAMAAAP
jgi:GMP synthase-like glutamine amidotransferase